tara:strand:+ start:38 stop:445 length:408 start_codon:yes stop_codon:yes gene_type:complete
MTTEQLAKDLLAIIDSEMYVNDFGGLQAGRDATTDIHAAIGKLEEALAQPEPERDWLPEHKCGLHLIHNEHLDMYQTVEEFYEEDWFISPEEWNKAIEEDNVWVLHWYPTTPVGFIRIAASTLEAIKAKLKEKNT